MRSLLKIFMATMLLLVLPACNTSTPNPDPNPCVENCPVDPTDPTDPTNPTDPTDPTDPVDPIDPVDPTDPVFEPNKMKGVLENFRPNKQLVVRAYWLDESGNPVDISGELASGGENTLETDGSFGIRLGDLADEHLVGLQNVEVGPGVFLDDLECGSLTIPADKKVGIAPNLYVFDGEELIGAVVQGSFDLNADGTLYPAAKVATRVYSSESNGKVIVQGECTGDDLLAKNNVSVDLTIGDILEYIGIDESYALAANITDILYGFGLDAEGIFNALHIGLDFTLGDLLGTLDLTRATNVGDSVGLEFDLGLVKGWNAVVFSADASDGTLQLAVADDTKVDFKWYFVPFGQFEQFLLPIDPPPLPNP
jgi:hypothetical protein